MDNKVVEWNLNMSSTAVKMCNSNVRPRIKLLCDTSA